MALDQTSRYVDLSLNEDQLIADGNHVLVAYTMEPAVGYSYISTAAHFAAESSTGTNVEVCTTDDFTKGVDALVFTAGIGERSAPVRAADRDRRSTPSMRWRHPLRTTNPRRSLAPRSGRCATPGPPWTPAPRLATPIARRMPTGQPRPTSWMPGIVKFGHRGTSPRRATHSSVHSRTSPPWSDPSGFGEATEIDVATRDDQPDPTSGEAKDVLADPPSGFTLIEGWFGQVGAESQTVASGVAIWAGMTRSPSFSRSS